MVEVTQERSPAREPDSLDGRLPARADVPPGDCGLTCRCVAGIVRCPLGTNSTAQLRRPRRPGRCAMLRGSERRWPRRCSAAGQAWSGSRPTPSSRPPRLSPTRPGLPGRPPPPPRGVRPALRRPVGPHHICGPLMEPTRRKATVTMRLSTRTCHQPLGPSPPGHGAARAGPDVRARRPGVVKDAAVPARGDGPWRPRWHVAGTRGSRQARPTPGATPTCGWSPGCQAAASGPGW
jgi:hypothetical protein